MIVKVTELLSGNSSNSENFLPQWVGNLYFWSKLLAKSALKNYFQIYSKIVEHGVLFIHDHDIQANNFRGIFFEANQG